MVSCRKEEAESSTGESRAVTGKDYSLELLFNLNLFKTFKHSIMNRTGSKVCVFVCSYRI